MMPKYQIKAKHNAKRSRRNVFHEEEIFLMYISTKNADYLICLDSTFQQIHLKPVSSVVCPFLHCSFLFLQRKSGMMVDQEHGHRNCIIPQGSHLEESSINRAKHEEKDGRIISGIFHSNSTKQNLWHSPYWRCFKARAAVIHRVTVHRVLSPLKK